MAFYQMATVRANVTGSLTNSTHDSLISAKGAEADNHVQRRLLKLYNESRTKSREPVIDISAGQINGVSAPADIVEAANNLATALVLLAIAQKERSDGYLKLYEEIMSSITRNVAAEHTEIFGANL
jgi:hypothetical protein